MIVTWSLDPVAFHWMGHPVHWYGVLYVVGFIFAYNVFERIMLCEGRTRSECWQLLGGMAAATFIGGRLGHCFFYHSDYYLAHPGEIVAIWRGGVSSHGVVLSSFLFVLCWCRLRKDSVLWICDRLCVCIPFTAACVRLGNFANSEIVGVPTDGSWGVLFTRVDGLVRHPVVLYEAAANFFVFGLMLWLYYHSTYREVAGRLWGLFFVLLFGFRFGLEAFKDSPDVTCLSVSLTMGQWLSIPCIVAGCLLLVRPYAKLVAFHHADMSNSSA